MIKAMNQILKICTLLLSLFSLSLLIFLGRADVQAAVYKYVDKNGNVHFTDRPESIPEEYRNQINVLKEEEKSKPAFRKKEGVAGEGERQSRGAEERKEEAKTLQEKSAREEKWKEDQEIQNRISDLQDQIRIKQEEQRTLRTTWMVNDRIKLNQLNQEIAAMEQEIRSLQKKLGEEK